MNSSFFARFPRVLVAALLPLCASASALAQWLLASPVTEVTSGAQAEILVGVPSDTPLPDRLTATLSIGSRRMLVQLERIGGMTGVVPRYRLQIPAEQSGLATLELVDEHSSRLLLQVVVPATLASAIENRLGERAPTARVEEPPSPSLQPNEPMYFLVGSSGTDLSARFQLSMKYRLFDPKGLAAGFLPYVSNLYFGYTQNSIWDLSGDSKPFRDTSYRPSFFYDWQAAEGEGAQLKIRAGYEHESNGREGPDSRSIDTLFAKPSWRFALERGNFLEISPKFWIYLDREDNPDIARYRGYADLTVRAGDHSALVGQVHLRSGTAGKGSLQFDLSYRLKRSLFADVGGFIHAQYFIGYGESILDYNRYRRPEFRLGFSIVR